MSTTPALDAAAKSRILVACILGTTVVTVDSTAVNVALPAIAEDLGGGQLRPVVVFALELTLVVAPLTATVLADADDHNAGIASAVNNAIARVAGLVPIAAIGALIAAQYGDRLRTALGDAAGRADVVALSERPFAVDARDQAVRAAQAEASAKTFHFGAMVAAVLVGLGGVLGLVGIRDPRREVAAEGCSGGQLVGVPQDASRQSPCDWGRDDDLPVLTVPARAAS